MSSVQVAALVGGLVEQRLQGRVLQRLGGVWVVEHLLERGVHALRLADLLDGAAVVPRVRRSGAAARRG